MIKKTQERPSNIKWIKPIQGRLALVSAIIIIDAQPHQAPSSSEE